MSDRDAPGSLDTDVEDDLRAAVDGLGRLVMGPSADESLGRIAVLTVRAIPGASGAGVTMLETGRAETVAVSDPLVRLIDDLQYGLGEGPCITAAAENRVVVSGDLGREPSWPRFGVRVEALGVHSVLSLPLVLEAQVVGALNVYARAHDVFDDTAARIGTAFAVPAAVAVANTRVLVQARRLSDQLEAALTNRAVIDQAIGIIRSRRGGTADDAFGWLRSTSQSSNTKLSSVAAHVVDEATRRARARHRDPPGPPGRPGSA